MASNKMVYASLRDRKKIGQKSLAVLIDPDKVASSRSLMPLINSCQENCVDYFFIGGSLITNNKLSTVVRTLKEHSSIPVVLFPGSNMQIDLQADAILLLSLISGRNPEMLIGQHVVAAPILKNSNLEILSTGYMLISDTTDSAVSYMSNTTPIPMDKRAIAACTAMAGEMLGLGLIYLDAGSGAKKAIDNKMISAVRKAVDVPLIVGGGINSGHKVQEALAAGADIIVIGNAIEKNPNLLIEVSEKLYDFNKSLNVH